MKQRIMSRSEIARVMLRRRERMQTDTTYQDHDSGDRERQAMEDLFFYFIADGDTVKIYVDRDMGGTVVEVKD